MLVVLVLAFLLFSYGYTLNAVWKRANEHSPDVLARMIGILNVLLPASLISTVASIAIWMLGYPQVGNWLGCVLLIQLLTSFGLLTISGTYIFHVPTIRFCPYVICGMLCSGWTVLFLLQLDPQQRFIN